MDRCLSAPHALSKRKKLEYKVPAAGAETAMKLRDKKALEFMRRCLWFFMSLFAEDPDRESRRAPSFTQSHQRLSVLHVIVGRGIAELGVSSY